MPADAPLLGFGLPVSGAWATPAAMVRVATAAEDAGYGSLWTFQRLLHPAEGDWGPMYRAVHDPLIVLAHVAAVTRSARLGVAVLNMPFYSPVVLAKQLTTLDVVSDGRLDVGLGIGWAPEEFTATGAPTDGRGARADEFLRCLTALWGPDPVTFDGVHHQVPPARVQPKPVQLPHPPVLVGAAADAGLRRAGRLADGWVSASRHDLTTIGRSITVVREAAEAAGRDPSRLRFVVRGVVTLGRERTTADGVRRPLSGSTGQIREDLAHLAEQGVTEVFLDPNFDPAIGSPEVPAADAERRAMRLLETLAPASAA